MNCYIFLMNEVTEISSWLHTGLCSWVAGPSASVSRSRELKCRPKDRISGLGVLVIVRFISIFVKSAYYVSIFVKSAYYVSIFVKIAYYVSIFVKSAYYFSILVKSAYYVSIFVKSVYYVRHIRLSACIRAVRKEWIVVKFDIEGT